MSRRLQFGTSLGLVLSAAFVAACSSTINVGDPSPPSAPIEDSPAGSGAPGAGPSETKPDSKTWEGAWEWLTPQTTLQSLRAGWVAADNDIWLVGDGGTVLRWDGRSSARIAYQGPVDASYRAIVASSVDDVWIAGDHAALHFNGTSWTSSVLLAHQDVRQLVRGEDGEILARTADHRVTTTTMYQPYSFPVFDVVAAPGSGFYLLEYDGVYLLRGSTHERVTSLVLPRSATSVVEARLLGRNPSTFRYLFGFRSQVATYYYGTWYGLYDSRDLEKPVWQRDGEIYTNVAQEPPSLLERIDSERLLLRIPRRSELWLFDGNDIRKAASKGEELGALVLPTTGPAVLGKNGYVASVSPSVIEGSLDVRDISRSAGASPGLFAVAPDSSAWAVKGTTYDTTTYYDTLGAWHDDVGWQWYSLPTLPFGARTNTVAIAPISSTSVWLVLRTTSDGNPLYAGGETLAHWNGVSFDVMRRAPKSLASIQSDRADGFFAIAVDGELLHADAAGNLTPLADVGTAGEDSFSLCSVRLAPLSETKVWTLDRLCRLSFWNGTALEGRPSFRSQGSGWIGYEMWAASETSLWVIDPTQGLQHFDGSGWSLTWQSQQLPRGIWGADDEHVWFVDGNSPLSATGLLRMWDGKAVRTIAAIPAGGMLGGGRDSAWLAGDKVLLRLRAASGASVR